MTTQHLLVLSATVFLAACELSAGGIKPGKWDITIQMAQGGNLLWESKVSRCIDADDAADPGNSIFILSQLGECTATRSRFSGGKFSIQTVCPDRSRSMSEFPMEPGYMASEVFVEGTYSLTALNGKLSAKLKDAPKSFNGTLSARRTGDCIEKVNPATPMLQPGRWSITHQIFREGTWEEAERGGLPPPKPWQGSALRTVTAHMCIGESESLQLQGETIVWPAPAPLTNCQFIFIPHNAEMSGSRTCKSPDPANELSEHFEGEYGLQTYEVRGRQILHRVLQDGVRLPLSFIDTRTRGRHVGLCTGEETPLAAFKAAP